MRIFMFIVNPVWALLIGSCSSDDQKVNGDTEAVEGDIIQGNQSGSQRQNLLEPQIREVLHGGNIYIKCIPIKPSNFLSIEYMIQNRNNDLKILSFDEGVNKYIENDIVYFDEIKHSFQWMKSNDTLDIFNLKFHKDDNYYRVFANLDDAGRSANFNIEEYNRYELFSINRKTGIMSSPSFNVAKCDVAEKAQLSGNKM